MNSKIAFAMALFDTVCALLGIQAQPYLETQPLMEIKIEEGIPYGKDLTDQDWVRLGDAIAPPVEWVNDDVGRRNEAVTLYKPSDIHVRMVNEKDGWLVVTYGRGVANADTYVYKTSDGGKTWKECTPPPLPHYGYVSAIGFINEERLLIAGWRFNGFPPLVFTADGGSTWTEIQTPNPIADCVVIAVKNNMITIIFNSGDMMRSRDLGDSWETVWSTQQ